MVSGSELRRDAGAVDVVVNHYEAVAVMAKEPQVGVSGVGGAGGVCPNPGSAVNAPLGNRGCIVHPDDVDELDEQVAGGFVVNFHECPRPGAVGAQPAMPSARLVVRMPAWYRMSWVIMAAESGAPRAIPGDKLVMRNLYVPNVL